MLTFFPCLGGWLELVQVALMRNLSLPESEAAVVPVKGGPGGADRSEPRSGALNGLGLAFVSNGAEMTVFD